MLVQFNTHDLMALCAGKRFDLADGAELAFAHDLVVVEKKDGHTSGGDELVDLQTVAAVRGPGMPEDGDAATKAGQSGRILIADDLAALPLNENSVPAAIPRFCGACWSSR